MQTGDLARRACAIVDDGWILSLARSACEVSLPAAREEEDVVFMPVELARRGRGGENESASVDGVCGLVDVEARYSEAGTV